MSEHNYRAMAEELFAPSVKCIEGVLLKSGAAMLEQMHAMNKAADEIEALRKREAVLTDLLESARVICQRKGEETAWERFDARIAKEGIGCITAKTFRVLPSDKEKS